MKALGSFINKFLEIHMYYETEKDIGKEEDKDTGEVDSEDSGNYHNETDSQNNIVLADLIGDSNYNTNLDLSITSSTDSDNNDSNDDSNKLEIKTNINISETKIHKQNNRHTELGGCLYLWELEDSKDMTDEEGNPIYNFGYTEKSITERLDKHQKKYPTKKLIVIAIWEITDNIRMHEITCIHHLKNNGYQYNCKWTNSSEWMVGDKNKIIEIIESNIPAARKRLSDEEINNIYNKIHKLGNPFKNL